MSLYNSLINRLYEQNRLRGMKLGLNNTLKLDALLNNPSKSFSSIHIAGTNGKGSVATKIARAYQLSGYRVGLFTSPHLFSFRDRFCVNGKMVAEQQVVSYLEKIFQFCEEEEIPATFFEISTLLAFMFFREEKVDLAVIETGLGGRFDATNIVHPALSIITSISLDHTQILGDTIDAIAFEKGGIIKNKVPVVIGPTVPKKVIGKIAEKLQSDLIAVEENFKDYDQENQAVVRASLTALSDQFPLKKAVIDQALSSLPRCRFEVIEGKGGELTIVDVAHNPSALDQLFRKVNAIYGKVKIELLFGLGKDKDAKHCIEVISQHVKKVSFVDLSNNRGYSSGHLDELLHSTGFKQSNEQCDLKVVCGSFYMMEKFFLELPS